MDTITPTVGMPATMVVGSDRYAGTVIRVNAKGTRCWVQEDKTKKAPDYDYYNNQVYLYERDPDGIVREFSLRKSGSWEQKRGGAYYLKLGARRFYHDPSF